MILATFSAIFKSFPSRSILAGASGAIKDGERIALLGVNGSGKTTLLEILAGHVDFDSGAVEIPNAVNCGYLPQTIEFGGDDTLLDYTLGGLEKLLASKRRIDEIHELLTHETDDTSLLNELGRLERHFESAGGYIMEARAADALRGLGFADPDLKMKIAELSGGQRNRAALARTLISSPELLLLDEPTNHLDITGLEYLENYMKGFPGGVIYVSHDRAFIQKTATTIWELMSGRIIAFPGDFEHYLVEREARQKSLIENYEAQKEMIERAEDFIRRNIAGQKTRQAKSRRKMLAKLERLDRPQGPNDVAAIKFGGAERSTRIVVKSQDVGFAYDSKPILQGVSFEIERGERIGLIGPNGSGKTTAIRLITGELAPQVGQLDIGKKISIGYYDQLTENLNPDSTPLAAIWEIKPELTEGQVRSYLARFLFRGEDAFRRVSTFSGGEQSRLALARLIATAPNFLVLDEPTNHLDIPSREALEQALAEFDGAVLCVSHDRYFLDKFAQRTFVLDNGAIKIYLGNYSYCKEKMLEMALANDKPRPAGNKPVANAAPSKPREKRTNPLVIQKLDAQIARTEENIEAVENTLIGAENSSDWQKLAGLLNERDSLYDELEKLYQRRREMLES